MAASADRVRLGVIGAGWFASRRHCPDIVEHGEAELVSLCRRDRGELGKMAAAFGVSPHRCFAKYGDLLDTGDLDGVVICSPHHLHFEHAMAAFERGLHVLLEKPIAVTADEGRQLIAAARAHGLALVVAQNPPYWSHCRWLRDHVRSRVLGDIEGAAISYFGNIAGLLGLEPLPDSMPGVVKPTLFRQSARQNGGGFLMDGGSHLLCELIWCTGLAVTEISARMNDPEWDVRSGLTMKMNGGACVTLMHVADSGIRAKRHHSQYYGSLGTAELRGFPFDLALQTVDGADIELSETELPAAPTPVGNFIDCVRGDGEPELDPEIAVHIVEVIQAAYRSAREGVVIKLENPES